jgi:hypothetical protein
MRQYRAELLTDGPHGPMWCDVCDEAKDAAFRLTPLRAQREAARGDGEALSLCAGCAEGLADGAMITGADLEARRQRRRGSQEP